MPKYYFDVHNGSEVLFDNEGFDLADLKSARRFALELLGQAILGAASGELDGRVTVDVRDDEVGIVICVAATIEVAERFP
jgi:hypothetical protein